MSSKIRMGIIVSIIILISCQFVYAGPRANRRTIIRHRKTQARNRTYSTKRQRRFVGRTFNKAFENGLRRHYNRSTPGRNRFTRRQISRLVRSGMRRGRPRVSRSTLYGYVPHQTVSVRAKRNRRISYLVESNSYVQYRDYQYDEAVSGVLYTSPRKLTTKPKTRKIRYYWNETSWYYIRE